MIGPAVNEGLISEFVVATGTQQFAGSPCDTETLNLRLHWFPQDVPSPRDSWCFLQGSTKGAAKIWKLFGGARWICFFYVSSFLSQADTRISLAAMLLWLQGLISNSNSSSILDPNRPQWHQWPHMRYPRGPHQLHILTGTSPCPATLARYQTQRREVLRQDQGQRGAPLVGNQQLRSI